MKHSILVAGLGLALLLVSSMVLAKTATINAGGEDVQAANDMIEVSVALPGGVVGKRVDRAILEVALSLGESVDSLYNHFPLVQVSEYASELPKQTVLLARNFAGIARFDVTRFVRAWSTTDAHQFVLGALTEANGTAIELGSTPAGWAGGQKARLVVEFQDRDGTSLTSQVE